MRVKVIPKRGFRLWEPALAGAALAVPLHAASVHERYTGQHVWLFWLLAISSIVSLPVLDAVAHRRFWRAVLRSAIFGLTFGLLMALLTIIDIPVYYVMYAIGGGWLGVILTSIIPTTLAAVTVCVMSNTLLMLILGRHIHPRNGLCRGCLYPCEGLNEHAPCPECGRDPREPLRGIIPNADRLRRIVFIVASLALLGQAVYSATVVRRFVIPIHKFEASVPTKNDSTLSTYITMHHPNPGSSAADQADETRVLRKTNVRLLAEERELTLTHLTTFLIIDHNGAPLRIEIVAGEVLGSASWGFARGDNPENDGLVWTLNPEATQRFLNGEGLTEQRIITILDQIRPNDLTNTNRRRELDW